MSRLVSRPRSAHALIIGILIATCLLVTFGIIAAHQQTKAVAALVAANRRVSGERLAAEVERLITIRAEYCLQTADFTHTPVKGSAGCGTLARRFYRIHNGKITSPTTTTPLTERIIADFEYQPHSVNQIVFPLAYAMSPRAQLFYRVTDGVMQILEVDLDVIEHSVFRELSQLTAIDASLRERSGKSDATLFPTLFPFWELVVHGSEETSPPSMQVVAFAGVTLFSAVMLVASVAAFFQLQMKASELMRDRNTLISGFTHALKTPLTNIRLYSDLLRDSEHDTPMVEWAEIIGDQTHRLERQIDNVLTLSRLGRVHRSYEMVNTDLVTLARSVLAENENWIGRAGFTIETDFPPRAVYIHADPHAITEAIINLIENATKYAQPRSIIELTIATDLHDTVLVVRDYGPGISRREQKRVFEPFYRNPQHFGKGGIGLGLYLVREIMRAHDGTVHVKSTPGQGSAFELRFPKI